MTGLVYLIARCLLPLFSVPAPDESGMASSARWSLVLPASGRLVLVTDVIVILRPLGPWFQNYAYVPRPSASAPGGDLPPDDHALSCPVVPPRAVDWSPATMSRTSGDGGLWKKFAAGLRQLAWSAVRRRLPALPQCGFFYLATRSLLPAAFIATADRRSGGCS